MEEDSSFDLDIEKFIPAHVIQVRSILQDEHNLAIPNECDDFIARCLRLKDGNLEKAVKLIRAFHTATADFQGWNATLQPSCYSEFYNKGGVIPLLKKDACGRRIFIVRGELWDPQTMDCDEAILSLWMIAQFGTAEFLDMQTKGFVTIWDFSNFSFQQAWAFKQWRLIALCKWIQNGVGGRMKAFHAVNHPRIVSFIYAGIKPFLKEKLKKRIIFHNDMHGLYKHIDPQILPTFLGGTLDLEDIVDRPFIDSLLSSDTYFKQMMNNRLPNK